MLDDVGVGRVIVGTQALKQPEWFRQMAAAFPGRLVLGIDARNSMVATEGWLDVSQTAAYDLARQYADLPLAVQAFNTECRGAFAHLDDIVEPDHSRLRRRNIELRNHLTGTTIGAPQAADWGLVDCCAERTGPLLAQHLGRLSKLSKDGIARYKNFMNSEIAPVKRYREAAVAANREIFSDPRNLQRITSFVEHGIYPWQQHGPNDPSGAGEGGA